jgi:hypothetical protein
MTTVDHLMALADEFASAKTRSFLGWSGVTNAKVRGARAELEEALRAALQPALQPAQEPTSAKPLARS